MERPITSMRTAFSERIIGVILSSEKIGHLVRQLTHAVSINLDLSDTFLTSYIYF